MGISRVAPREVQEPEQVAQRMTVHRQQVQERNSSPGHMQAMWHSDLLQPQVLARRL
jgi:hypothetical protein